MLRDNHTSMEKRLFLTTFGCQMNEKDSERIAGLLKGLDYKLTDRPEKADLILINTCSIREKAEYKLYSTLGRYKRLKQKRGTIIGVGGCVAQQEGERLLQRIPYLDLVFGTHNIHRLPEMIKEIEEKKTRVCRTEFYNKLEPDESFTYTIDEESRVKAYVSIMRGCDNFCSYCIVPYVRGRELSRRSEAILREIRDLAEKGVKEVTLLGQNVNSYGKNLRDEISFPELIRRIGEIDGIERIRFTTSHPKDLSEELIYTFAEVEKLCNHIHLPVQSGSNRILKLMKRRYTREEYLRKVERLREVVPDIAITTDCIVGFPTEREEDFEETLSLLREVEFDSLFSFKFSPRPMTEAARMDGQIPEDVKLRRLKILQDLQKAITIKKNKALEGRVVKVLVEGESKRNPAEITGRTTCNRIVNLPGSKDLIGKIVDVRIEESFTNSLRGRRI